jgi:hypothetical protein
MSEIVAFQNAFHSAGLSISNRRRLSNLATGFSPWQTLNAPPGKNVLACSLQGSVPLTASGAVSLVNGADLLTEWVDQVQVAATEGTQPRIETATTFGCEELERVCFDTAQGWSAGDIADQSGSIGSYKRATPANFTTEGSRTDTSELWVPVGGPSAALRFHIPSITGAYATLVTVSSYTVAWFEVYSPYGGVVAANETITPSLGTGNQDFQQFVPKNQAVDLVSFIGTSGTVTYVTEVYMTDNTGASVINMDSAQSITATQYVYPRFATNAPTYNALCFQLNKTYPVSFRVKVGSASTFDILWVAFQGANTAPANTPSATPAPPAVNQVGRPVTGIGPTGLGAPSLVAANARA